MKYKDASELIGQKFGRLLVLAKSDNRKSGHVQMCCVCDCGAHVEVAASSLAKGTSMSCGCLCRERIIEYNKVFKKKHGGSKDPLYNVWRGMQRRCFNPKERSYVNYGGRGITVCDAWAQDYTVFKKWALANGYEEGLTIERVDVNKGYSPDNCTWIPRAKQSVNRRNVRLYNGIPAIEIAHEHGISKTLMYMRIKHYGWPIEEAIGLKPHEYKTNWGNKQRLACC